MRIPVSYLDDVAIVSPKGKITIGVGDVALRNIVTDLVRQGRLKILVVLSDITSIDSSGMQALTSMYAKLYEVGGQVVLVDPPAKVTDILQITQLITVFQVAETVEEGLKLLHSTGSQAS